MKGEPLSSVLEPATETPMVGKSVITLDDFDAAHAVLGRIAFPGTTIHAINLQHAVADDVDLRGAELQEIHDVAGLRGTTMLVDQISQLAQSFAASLGIRLEEPEG